MPALKTVALGLFGLASVWAMAVLSIYGGTLIISFFDPKGIW